MKLEQAISSGRRFKRESWWITSWCNVNGFGVIRANCRNLTLRVSDLLADDYILEPMEITITEDKFNSFIFSLNDPKLEDLACKLKVKLFGK